MPSFAIRRTRLEQLLDDHPDSQVILVRGPAGAGKTVLVAQWVSAHDDPCVWVAVDATDDHGDVLLRRIAEATGHLAPDIAVVGGRLTDGGGIDDTMPGEALDTVTHRLRPSVVLVLDDVHRLRSRSARHVIERLVERPPRGVRVVLISRCKPGLGLERARLRGDLVEVTPTALRFERAEIDALASSWAGQHPDASDLERVTLGWAAGLRLAQLESADRDAVSPGLLNRDDVVSEYICEELIDAASAGLRSFLEVSCWLPVLTEPLCAALTRGAAPLTPSDIEALPILPVSSRPGAFRYPPRLTRVLQQEYRRRDPDAALTACRRAADASRGAGELVTAVRLFLDADCADDAAEVCAELAARGESSLRRVDELLQRSPELTPAGTPWLAWRIRAAIAAGRVDEACRLLEQADDAATSAETRAQAGDLDLVMARAVVAEQVGDVATLLACADRLLASEGDAGPGASVTRLYGWTVRALVWSGDADGAKSALRALDEAHATAGSPAGALVDIALARAWVAWFDGDVAGTAEALTAAQSEIGGDGAGSGEVALLAGSAHRERNQLAKAVPLLQEAADSAHHVVAALAASELARCRRAAGAEMDALELVMSTHAAHPRLPSAVDACVRRTEVWLRLDQGDVAGAHEVVRSASPGGDTELLAARVALHHAPDTVRELLRSVGTHTRRQAVEKLLVYAQLPDADDDEVAATVTEAITTGAPLGLVRTFLDEGPAMSRRLSHLGLECTDRTVGRLAAVAAHDLALRPEHVTTGPVEQLTPRELAVLRMLPLRMSNREMAGQLYISVNTLKTHVRAIYRKLDVPHRSAAVRRATALQLV